MILAFGKQRQDIQCASSSTTWAKEYDPEKRREREYERQRERDRGRELKQASMDRRGEGGRKKGRKQQKFYD